MLCADRARGRFIMSCPQLQCRSSRLQLSAFGHLLGCAMEDWASDAGGSSAAGKDGKEKETEANLVIVPPVAPWTCDGPDGLVCDLCNTSPSAASPYPSDHKKHLKYAGKWPWRRYDKFKFRAEWLVDDLESADATVAQAAQAALLGTMVRVPARPLCMICFQLFAMLGQLREKIIED